VILYRKDVGTLNDQGMFEYLIEQLKKFNGFVIPNSDFIVELCFILSRNGEEKRFILRLVDYLTKLQKYGTTAIQRRGASMEHLNGEQQLCSMRFKFSASNVRILFAYINDKVYLLSAFSERQGHRNTEYAAYTGPANERLQDMLREEEE